MAVGDKKTAQPAKSRAVKSPVIEGKVDGKSGSDSRATEQKATSSRLLVPGLIVAMVVGGGLGVAGSYGLAQMNFWPASPTNDQKILADQEALALRIDGLVQAVSDLDQKPAPDLSGFANNGQLDTLRGDVTALENAVGTRLDVLEQVEPVVLGAQDFGPIQSRLESLATVVEGLRADGSGTDLSAALGETAALVAGLEAGRIALAENQSGLVDEIAVLRGQIETLLAENDGLQSDLSAFEMRVDDVVRARAVGLQNSGDMVARLSLALALIDTSLEGGASFAAPFAVIKKSGLAAQAVAGLDGIAATGAVAPSSQIVAFKKLVSSLVVADDMAQPTKTRLLSKLKSSIGMRPIGMAKGSDAAAIVARIETYLERGDFTAAYREWQLLPDEAQETSSNWAQGLKGYIDARAMVELVRAAALQNLGGTQ